MAPQLTNGSEASGGGGGGGVGVGVARTSATLLEYLFVESSRRRGMRLLTRRGASGEGSAMAIWST